MLVANPAFAALVSRLPRRRFIPFAHRFFMANLALFFALFHLLPHRSLVLGYAFYIWLSVFNLFVVSLFWGLMSDLFREEQGKRLFGLLAMGGTLGAIVGAGLTGALSTGLSLGGRVWKAPPSAMLLASIRSRSASCCWAVGPCSRR